MTDREDRKINPIEMFTRLVVVHGGPRARTLMGTLMIVEFYGPRGVIRRGLLSEAVLYRDLRDIRSAGLTDSLELAEQLGAMQAKMWEIVEAAYPDVAARVEAETEREREERDREESAADAGEPTAAASAVTVGGTGDAAA